MLSTFQNTSGGSNLSAIVFSSLIANRVKLPILARPLTPPFPVHWLNKLLICNRQPVGVFRSVVVRLWMGGDQWRRKIGNHMMSGMGWLIYLPRSSRPLSDGGLPAVRANASRRPTSMWHSVGGSQRSSSSVHRPTAWILDDFLPPKQRRDKDTRYNTEWGVRQAISRLYYYSQEFKFCYITDILNISL